MPAECHGQSDSEGATCSRSRASFLRLLSGPPTAPARALAHGLPLSCFLPCAARHGRPLMVTTWCFKTATSISLTQFSLPSFKFSIEFPGLSYMLARGHGPHAGPKSPILGAS